MLQNNHCDTPLPALSRILAYEVRSWFEIKRFRNKKPFLQNNLEKMGPSSVLDIVNLGLSEISNSYEVNCKFISALKGVMYSQAPLRNTLKFGETDAAK